jgi:hypothetical protein
MSAWLDHAELVAERIRAEVSWCRASVPEAGRVAVIVDRKLDIQNIITQTAAKAAGASVVVTWVGAKNPDPDANILRTGAEYSIACMTRPIIKDSTVTCDQLTEDVAQAIHGWQPPLATPALRPRRLRVRDIALVPQRSLLIYEITADIVRL